MRARRQPGAGFSMIEVIVALGLMAAVMLSISGLFVQGSHAVQGGKEVTEALATATDILEDLGSRSYLRLYRAFGAGDSDTGFSADTRTNGFASGWQAQIEEALWQGHAVIELTPLGVDTLVSTCSGVATPTFGCGQGIRTLVILEWQERGETRSLRLSSVRF